MEKEGLILNDYISVRNISFIVQLCVVFSFDYRLYLCFVNIVRNVNFYIENGRDLDKPIHIVLS